MSSEHPDSIRNDTNSLTLSRVIMSHTKDTDFVILINAVSTACKLVSRSVRKAGIAGLCKISKYSSFTRKSLRHYHYNLFAYSL